MIKSIDTTVALLKRRRTKILATLGPASSDPEVLRQMILAGVNIFRLNMSHSTHESHAERYRDVRAAAEELGKPVAIIADLCGPKIRVGQFEKGAIDLVEGETVTITTQETMGKDKLIPSQYAELDQDVTEGDTILLDDGNLQLLVIDVDAPLIKAKVIVGGLLKDNKGINLPGVDVSAPSMTEKDYEDATFALALGVEFLALSFVRKSSDVERLRGMAASLGHEPSIISKIEKPEALQDISNIIAVSDAIMIARGDLGVELPPQTVPIAQDQLIDLARKQNTPVIVATQMLDSMVDNSRPTRAEVSDVSHAVWRGVDAVMLSAETAIGKYPIETIKMMDAVARETEAYLFGQRAFGNLAEQDLMQPPIPLADAIAHTTAQLSRDLMVRAILVLSRSGRTATVVSSARPAAPVLAAAVEADVCRKMNLLWGVVPFKTTHEALEDWHRTARQQAKKLDLATKGDFILVVRGFHRDPKRTAPSVSVLEM